MAILLERKIDHSKEKDIPNYNLHYTILKPGLKGNIEALIPRNTSCTVCSNIYKMYEIYLLDDLNNIIERLLKLKVKSKFVVNNMQQSL